MESALAYGLSTKQASSTEILETYMALSVTADNLPASWKRSLEGGRASSVHCVLAMLFNSSCLLAFTSALRHLKAMRQLEPGVLVFLAFVFFFLVLAAMSAVQVYRKARAEIQVRDNPAVLVMSYLAFRLYIMVLGVAIMLFATIGLTHR